MRSALGSSLARAGGGAGGGGGGSSLLTGLQAWYDLPGGDANQVDDSGNGHTLSPNNSPGQSAGGAPDGENCAFVTRANSEYYSIAHNAAFSPGAAGDIGFSVWVRFQSVADYMAILAKYQSASDREWFLRYNNGTSKIEFVVYGVTSGEFNVALPDTISAATWYHLSGGLSVANQQIALALNAGTLQTTTFDEDAETSSVDFTVGADAAVNQELNARVAMAGIWNRVPTAAERTSLYGGGSGLRHPF